jgi:hypothetical protein
MSEVDDDTPLSMLNIDDDTFNKRRRNLYIVSGLMFVICANPQINHFKAFDINIYFSRVSILFCLVVMSLYANIRFGQSEKYKKNSKKWKDRAKDISLLMIEHAARKKAKMEWEGKRVSHLGKYNPMEVPADSLNPMPVPIIGGVPYILSEKSMSQAENAKLKFTYIANVIRKYQEDREIVQFSFTVTIGKIQAFWLIIFSYLSVIINDNGFLDYLLPGSIGLFALLVGIINLIQSYFYHEVHHIVTL